MCSHCGELGRLVAWTRGPDDHPPGGSCPRCGCSDRQVATGITRVRVGRLPPTPS
jgi:hypothetical protein